MNKNNNSIAQWLRNFNEVRDEILIELSILLLMAGFIAGTVDILTRGGMSTYEPFTIAWAIVQAVAIDGLFFAVWGRVGRATWTRYTLVQNTVLILVGLLLATVAILVNGLLSYQELYNVASTQTAMKMLGIDQTAFTYSRSILVVFVSILVTLFCREKKAIQVVTQSPNVTITTEKHTAVTIAKEQTAMVTLADSVTTTPQPIATRLRATKDTQEDSVTTITVSSTKGYRERIKDSWLRLLSSGQKPTLQDIANEAGVSRAAVKKWAKDIKQEIENEQTVLVTA